MVCEAEKTCYVYHWVVLILVLMEYGLRDCIKGGKEPNAMS